MQYEVKSPRCHEMRLVAPPRDCIRFNFRCDREAEEWATVVMSSLREAHRGLQQQIHLHPDQRFLRVFAPHVLSRSRFIDSHFVISVFFWQLQQLCVSNLVEFYLKSSSTGRIPPYSLLTSSPFATFLLIASFLSSGSRKHEHV